jgi:hypothetical protein
MTQGIQDTTCRIDLTVWAVCGYNVSMNDELIRIRVPAKLRKQVKLFAKEQSISESAAWRMLATQGLLRLELDKSRGTK